MMTLEEITNLCAAVADDDRVPNCWRSIADPRNGSIWMQGIVRAWPADPS